MDENAEKEDISPLNNQTTDQIVDKSIVEENDFENCKSLSKVEQVEPENSKKGEVNSFKFGQFF